MAADTRGVTVQVDGLRELRRDLKRFVGDAGDLKDANAAAAAIVAPAAAARAPRRTGRLAASVRGSRTVGAAEVKAGGSSTPYAGPIHWGWPARHIEAQPFIADAAEATMPQWLPAYSAALQAAADRVNT